MESNENIAVHQDLPNRINRCITATREFSGMTTEEIFDVINSEQTPENSTLLFQKRAGGYDTYAYTRGANLMFLHTNPYRGSINTTTPEASFLDTSQAA